jgi:ubiquinol-cytochrome c reductase iron-sulfur subunit
MPQRPSSDPSPSLLARALSLLVALRTAWLVIMRRRPPAPLTPGRPEPDPSQRQIPANRRAEALVAALLMLGALFGFGFTTIYVVLETNTQLLGLAMAGTLGMLAAAAILAGKLVVPQEISVEPRDQLLEEDQVEDVVEIVESGGEGISRRGLLVGAGGVAGVALVTAAAAPLASLGPTPGGLHENPWSRGVGLVDEQGHPYAAAAIETGSFYTALPEGGNTASFGAGLLVVKLPAEMIHLPPARRGWAPEGILAFSKICPHAGCAISLYRYPTFEPTSAVPAFTCPCHYSTFTPGDGGQCVFGPAGRPLPQLPLMIDAQGDVRAAGRFDEDIGPSWWDGRRVKT